MLAGALLMRLRNAWPSNDYDAGQGLIAIEGSHVLDCRLIGGFLSTGGQYQGHRYQTDNPFHHGARGDGYGRMGRFNARNGNLTHILIFTLKIN